MHTPTTEIGFIHVDAYLSAIPLHKQLCAFPCEECEEQTSVHLGCKADIKRVKYTVSIEQEILGSDCMCFAR